MTALHALRLAAAEQPDGDLKRLLTWAEMHIGDQYERICELEDARRIVACLNALAGVSTEHLEQYGLPDFAQKISDLAQQRDKLLAALEKCRDMVGHPDNVDFINAAIAEMKGQS